MADEFLRVAARIASQKWGGRWTATDLRDEAEEEVDDSVVTAMRRNGRPGPVASNESLETSAHFLGVVAASPASKPANGGHVVSLLGTSERAILERMVNGG
jgi:hypothetical protein